MAGYKLPFQDIWQNVYDPSTETIKTSGGAVPTDIFARNEVYDGSVWRFVGGVLVGSRYAMDVNIVAGATGGGLVQLQGYSGLYSVWNNINAEGWGNDPTGVYMPEAIFTNDSLFAWDGGRFQRVRCDTSGRLEVAGIYPSLAIRSNHVTVPIAGTPIQLATGITGQREVVVKSFSANTGNIYMGDATVSNTTGFILEPGESVSIEIDDLGQIWLDSDVNAEGVSYLSRY